MFEFVGGDEEHPAYQQLSAANYDRLYDFLESMVMAAIATNRPYLSQSIIKALNFHAIAGLHHEAGEYRSHEVTVGRYRPPARFRVNSLMDDFVNRVNWSWQSANATVLAAFALWRINHIHPFVNGNGRTARAVCYYIVCVKSGGLLPGQPILPEVLRSDPEHAMYIDALKAADSGDLAPLNTLINQLIRRQVSG